VLITAINISQLYLGAVWLSQMSAGALLALLWVVVLGTAYRLHSTVPVAPRALAVIALATLFAAALGQYWSRYDLDLERYAPQREITLLDADAWWQSTWRALPAYRIDFRANFNQPLTVQWSGSLSELRADLRRQGWQTPPRLTAANALQWLRSNPPLTQLPLLPQAHDGRYDVLRLVRPTADPQYLTVLRLWSSNYELRGAHRPLWIGNVSQVRAHHPIPWVTVPITGSNFDGPLKTLRGSLASITDVEWKAVQRPSTPGVPWNGTVLLIRARTPP